MVNIGDYITTEITTTIDGLRVTVAVSGAVTRIEGSDRGLPTLYGQRWRPWGSLRYSRTSQRTFAQAGCYICALASLLRWAGYETDPAHTAAALDAMGGFAVGHLIAERAPAAFPRLQWDPRTSRADWYQAPADVEALAHFLEDKHPVIVQLDFDPRDRDIDTHFVLAYMYEPALKGGRNDRLWVMDPWDGAYLDAAEDAEFNFEGKRTGGGYFNPAWHLSGKTTRVQRVVTGARFFHIIPDGGI